MSINYFRIMPQWHKSSIVLPNAVDIQLGMGANPMMAAQEIHQYIVANCGVAPKSWTWKPITQTEYDLGDTTWFEPENGQFNGIKTKKVMVI